MKWQMGATQAGMRWSIWLLGNGMIYFAAALNGSIGEASSEFQQLIANGYDRKVRPNADGAAVNVSVQVSIVALGPIDEKTLTYDIDIFLRHFWDDDRIKLNQSKSLTYNGNPGQLLWIPDTYLPNARSVKTYKALTESMRATISPNGRIYISARMLATCSCKMDLRKYPMDTQKCFLLFESYAFSAKEIFYKWISTKPPVEIVEGGVQVSGYEVLEISTKEIKRSYATAEEFSMLELSFTIKRTFSYYLYRSYLPSSLLVVLTWGSFWLPADAVPARITMIVTNFLSTVFILNNAGSQITKVPYNTAMEVFLSTNAFFIILVLIEYLLLLQLGKDMPTKRNIIEDPSDNDIPLVINVSKRAAEDSAMLEQRTVGIKLRTTFSQCNIDSVSKLLFPAVYVIFLFSYFLFYYN